MPDFANATPLLPCPFCGAPAELERDGDHHGEWFNLGCSKHFGRVDPPCPGGRLWYTASPDNEAEAIAAWNKRATPAERAAPMEKPMTFTDDQIRHMVNRFLGWRLPDPWRPDGGIEFKPEFNVEYMASQGKPPMRHEPTGTNLFDYKQSTAMVRYMVEGMERAGDAALVPKEPTTDMCVAAVNRAPSRIGTGDAHVFYQAMLAAAPKEPGQ